MLELMKRKDKVLLLILCAIFVNKIYPKHNYLYLSNTQKH